MDIIHAAGRVFVAGAYTPSGRPFAEGASTPSVSLEMMESARFAILTEVTKHKKSVLKRI
jgi:hypothetical protein